MTAGLSNIYPYSHPITKCKANYNIHLMHANVYRQREKKFYMVKDTCLDSSLSVGQSFLLQDLEDYRRSQRLNNND
jgi:hypothetical protein